MLHSLGTYVCASCSPFLANSILWHMGEKSKFSNTSIHVITQNWWSEANASAMTADLIHVDIELRSSLGKGPRVATAVSPGSKGSRPRLKQPIASCQAYRTSFSSVDTRITLYSSIVHWVEIEPWERVQGLPLQSRQGPKARDRPVAKHIAPHCSIHKQPHILPSSVDTWVTHQQLRFVWDRQGPPWPLTCWGCRPPWRPRCWCCGHFFSNSRAWPWQFQAPNLLVRYKLKPKE